jgi:hypothetical protein
MTQPSVHIQIAATSVPSTPSWLGEVAVLAHVFNRFGLQKAIEERVRFARARMGDYEVMLMGYAPPRRTHLRGLLSTTASVCRTLHGTFRENEAASCGHPFPLSCSPGSRSRGGATHPLSGRPGGTIRIRFPAWRRVGSTGPAVDRDGCRWHKAGGQTTSTSSDCRPSCPSSPL